MSATQIAINTEPTHAATVAKLCVGSLAKFVRGEVLLPECAGRRVGQRHPVRDVQAVFGRAVGQGHEPPSRPGRDESPLTVASHDTVVTLRAARQ